MDAYAVHFQLKILIDLNLKVWHHFSLIYTRLWFNTFSSRSCRFCTKW